MVSIGPGKNGEVYPCPECEKHETVRFIPSAHAVYRYHCDDCDRTFTKREVT